MEEKCRECGCEMIDGRIEGDPICLACATRKVYAASRSASLDASGDERQSIRELAYGEWTGDGWSDGALAVAEGLLAQIRDAVAIDPPADGADAGDPWRYCGGCGDLIAAETTAAWHQGVPYCRGCEEAPAEDADAE